MTDHYLSAEGYLIEQLKAKVPGFKAVLSAADLAGVLEAAQQTPAAHVLYWGERLGDSTGRGRAQMSYQQWLIVIATRNASTQRTGEAARNEAGPLIDAMLSALQGWAPANGQPLQRIPGPKAAYTRGGFAYFPFLFETRLER